MRTLVADDSLTVEARSPADVAIQELPGNAPQWALDLVKIFR